MTSALKYSIITAAIGLCIVLYGNSFSWVRFLFLGFACFGVGFLAARADKAEMLKRCLVEVRS